MNILKSILVNSLVQYWWLVGLMALFGLLLYILARTARTTYASASKSLVDIYITGWIGTPVHEFGHWIFCLIFAHKVKEVKFFKPDPKSKTLGYVSHSYDSKSIYQRVGNYFIGIGPIIIGSVIIAALAYFVLPSGKLLVSQYHDFVESWSIEVSYGPKSALMAVLDNLQITLKSLFTWGSIRSIYFWIFIYASISISSHMMLSIADIKLAFFGAMVVLAVLLVLNGTSEVIGAFSKNHFDVTLSNYLSLFSLKVGAILIFILTFAVIFSLVNVLISFIVKGLFSVIRK